MAKGKVMSAYILLLDSPHEDAVQAYREWKRSGGAMHWRLAERLRDLGLHRRINDTYVAPPSPWVARLDGSTRYFLNGSRIYSDYKIHGEDGAQIQFVLEPGELYEINEIERGALSKRVVRQINAKRYLARVQNGKLVSVL
jgi:hypothetical protein